MAMRVETNPLEAAYAVLLEHGAVLPSVPWQRCQFHLQQNAGQFVIRQEARKTVATQLRTIFNAPDKMEAERSCSRRWKPGARITPSWPNGLKLPSRKV
jgi:transposase-like protein